MDFNICSASDSYKFTHYNMYPKNTEEVYSYFESREGAKYDETVFFGLQYLLKEYLCGRVVTHEKIDKAVGRVNAHFGMPLYNIEMWRYIVDEHDGHLPIEIKAVPEGMPVPTGNVLMTVRNTDPKCFSLTNYLETILTHVWSASTVATLSREIKKDLKVYLDKTSDIPEALDFMLHDFGFRGATAFESSGFTGAGHLLNFLGTDNFPAIELLMDYYNSKEMPAFSVPATEHSIMTAKGREGEEELFEEILDQYPSGILSVVIDSYNYANFIKMAGTKFKDKIINRDGKLVFRPDSGDPVNVSVEVAGYLYEYFPGETNSKGYKTLDSKVGMLWGDGVNQKSIKDILRALKLRDFSSDIIVFGMGGALLQKMNRDTQKFAFKSSYQVRDGQGYDIYKDPVNGGKQSKKGKLSLIRDGNSYKTVNQKEINDTDILETVFKDGVLIRDMGLDTVRKNAEI